MSEHKSSLNNKKFVACGRCIRQKGFDLFSRSFHLFAEKESEWTLTIVGDGDMRSQLEEQIEALSFKRPCYHYRIYERSKKVSVRCVGLSVVITLGRLSNGFDRSF